MGEGVCFISYFIGLNDSTYSRKWIEDTIQSGTTIVCDRYYYSGMVYSAAKQNQSLSLAWARQPEVGLPRPDWVFFLDLEPEEAEKRGGFGEEKYEKKAFQAQVRKFFLDLQWCGGEEEEDMTVINAGGSVDEVGDLLWKDVEGVVTEVGEGATGALETVQGWKDAEEVLKKFGSFKACRSAVQNQNQS